MNETSGACQSLRTQRAHLEMIARGKFAREILLVGARSIFLEGGNRARFKLALEHLRVRRKADAQPRGQRERVGHI
jgi:hypothetical protein